MSERAKTIRITRSSRETTPDRMVEAGKVFGWRLTDLHTGRPWASGPLLWIATFEPENKNQVVVEEQR